MKECLSILNGMPRKNDCWGKVVEEPGERGRRKGGEHTVSAVRRSLNVTICAPALSGLGSILSNSPRCYKTLSKDRN